MRDPPAGRASLRTDGGPGGGSGRGRWTRVATAWPSRPRQRLGHLLLATVLGVHVYSPLASVPAFDLAVQVLVFPALALSGVLLWRGGRLRAWVRRRATDRVDSGGE